MRKTESTHVSAENIAAVARMEDQFLASRTPVERIGDAIGSFAGSMSFVVLHLAIFALWFLVNSKYIPGVPVFDPYPFVFLNMAVSLEAVLLSTFVLMKQNREATRAEQRQHLTLQINLLSEQEATKTLQMLSQICERLGIAGVKHDPAIQILSEDTAVDELAEKLRNDLPRQ